jgi:flagellar basal-body rod protein FlgB
MSWIDNAQMSLLQRYMDLSAKRQELITSNIANVDTPGYHARDIDFHAEMDRALSDPQSDSSEPFVREVPGLVPRPDGNNVSVDRESLLLSEVQLQFNIAEQILKARFKNLSTAIHEGGMSS